jgi:hypothetical protein
VNDAADKPKRRVPLRWLTLAEVVGVAALVIAGLGYWDAHRERAQEAQDRAAAARERQAEAKAGALKHTFLMTGAAQGAGDLIRLAPTRAEQVIQTQTVIFPTAVRTDPVQTTGNPRIERGWFEDGLKKAQHDRKHAQKAGDEGRLPVGFVTTYIEDGQVRTDRSVYELGYSLHDRFLRGPRVELDGLSLARRGVGGDLQPEVDRLWPADR